MSYPWMYPRICVDFSKKNWFEKTKETTKTFCEIVLSWE